MVRKIAAIVVVALVAVGLLVWSQRRHVPAKVSGLIEADEIRVGSRVGGRVNRVPAVEGQRVKKGEVLVELAPYDLLERRAQAQAELTARRAEYEKLKNGFRPEEIAQAKAKRDQLAARVEELKHGPRKQEIAAAEARVKAATADLELAQSLFERIKAGFDKNAVSAGELDRAAKELKAATANLTMRQQELDLLASGTRPEEIAQAEAELDQATAALELAQKGYRKEEVDQAAASAAAAQSALAAIERQIDELTVNAPVDAVVESLDLQPGDMVAPNAPMLSLVDMSNLWVRAYVPENRLNLANGQKLAVSVDSFPGKRFAGHVSFVAREAEFTPNNVQTPEERSKQVFRIKVTLDEGLDVLRPGMAADVWLE